MPFHLPLCCPPHRWQFQYWCTYGMTWPSGALQGEPKAIPWTHITPIRCAVDGWAHQDIRERDVVCWPTNLGWMMGPWLLYAALLNNATVALYEVSHCRFRHISHFSFLKIIISILVGMQIWGHHLVAEACKCPEWWPSDIVSLKVDIMCATWAAKWWQDRFLCPSGISTWEGLLWVRRSCPCDNAGCCSKYCEILAGTQLH